MLGTNGGNTSTESDILPVGGVACAVQRGVNPFGDEVEGCATVHGDRIPRVFGEHEDRRMVRGYIAPPPFQLSSGQVPQIGPNILRPRIHAPMFAESASCKVVIGSCRATAISKHVLKRLGSHQPLSPIRCWNRAQRLFQGEPEGQHGAVMARQSSELQTDR